eukprot:ANDGO_05829.mRNA.1 RAN GTPase-activating protein 1
MDVSAVTGFSELEDAPVSQLFALLPATRISNLALDCRNLEDVDIGLLCKVLPDSRVTVLNVSDNRISNDGMRILAETLPHSQVHDLDLSINFFDSQGVACLCEVLPSTKVARLNLSMVEVGDAGAAAIANALESPSCILEALVLESTVIEADGFRAIARAIAHSSLTELVLSGNGNGNAEGEGVAQLIGMLGMSKVVVLKLDNCGLSDADMELLAQTVGQTRLTCVSLECNNLSLEAFEKLCDAIAASGVVDLNVSANQLGDECVDILRHAGLGSRLQKLGLAESILTDAGFAELLKLASEFPTLEELNVSFNELGDASAEMLGSMLSRTSLKKVNLNGNAFGRPALRALSETVAALSRTVVLELDGMRSAPEV